MNEYAAKGHEFYKAIEFYFKGIHFPDESNGNLLEDSDEDDGRDISDISILGWYPFKKKPHLPPLSSLIRPLNDVLKGSKKMSLKYIGRRGFDGYYELDYENAEVNLSPMGAWQVCLLMTSSSLMPLYWHANYMRKQLILSHSDLESLRNSEGYDCGNHKFLPEDLPCMPSVQTLQEDKSYMVTYHYWTEFGGYVEQKVVISSQSDTGSVCLIKDLKIKQDVEIIFPYRAPIMF